jgi:hypothetical protein
MALRIYEQLLIVRFIPKAKDMDSLIIWIDGLITRLSAGLVSWRVPEEAFQKLKQGYEQEKQNVPIKNGTVIPDEWDQVPKNKKIQIYQEMNAIGHALMGLDFPNMRAGKIMLWIFVALLAGAVIAYLYAHMACAKEKDTMSPSTRIDVIEAKELLTLVQVGLDDVENAADASKQWEIVAGHYQTLVDKLRPESLSLRTRQYAGDLGGYIAALKPGTAKVRLESLTVAVMEDLREQPGRFFWIRGPMRWLEVASWAFFGVLVGVIFYLAQQLKQGMFDRQDIPSMIGEVVIAPIVTCVIFFLFTYTGITEFSPTDASIFIVLGFAFIFGYAIRRTVGLLDSLKRRILPEP